MTQGKITSRQFMAIVVFYGTGDLILQGPSAVVYISSRDAWITAIALMIFSFGLVWIYTRLTKYCPDMTFVECMEHLLGKVIGKAAGLLFCFFLLIILAYTVFIFNDFITAEMLPRTDRSIINVVCIAISTFCVYLGIENIARVSELLFPWVMGILILLFLALLPHVDIEIIRPILADGVKPITDGLYEIVTLELVGLLMIYPFVQNKGNRARAFFVGMLINGLIFVMITFLSVTILGINRAANLYYPTYLLAANINIGDIITRIESVLALSWMASQIVFTMLLLYAISLGLAQILKLRSYTPVVFPVALMVLAIVPTIIPQPSAFSIDSYPLFTGTFGLAMPAILLIVAFIRKRFHKSSSSSVSKEDVT